MVISQDNLVIMPSNKLGLTYLNLALKDSDDCVFVIIMNILHLDRRLSLITLTQGLRLLLSQVPTTLGFFYLPFRSKDGDESSLRNVMNFVV